ncbi:hypothetical protein CDD83_4846 [Cordyceps sp. RAO-2017]|nr:hypothetical protein CDD83_4846 [Cordyceps sp. RAO-2017]
MAPETRSRGAAPPSRVYHSSPALQQAQFPSRRRKIVRTYGRQTAASLRQQTLTQIDFVSSFDKDDGVIVLTDSSEDGGRDKENRSPSRPPAEERPGRSEGGRRRTATKDAQHREELGDDDEPVSSMRRRKEGATGRTSNHAAKNKRRRTLGDELDANEAAGDDKKR